MLLIRLRPLALALTASFALAWGVTEFSRPQYVIDTSGARAVPPNRGLYFPLAALAGLTIGMGLVVRSERRRRPVRGERALLPVVSAKRDDGRTRLAAELATMFSDMGVRTLLIDADLRSPGQHREFRIENRRGLANLLGDREVQPAVCGESLAVLVAGGSSSNPLELLSRPRLREFLTAAGKRFRVVLVDTPAAAEGPDLQIFAALAGGALVIHKKDADQAGLLGLRKHLDAARARTVSVVLTG